MKSRPLQIVSALCVLVASLPVCAAQRTFVSGSGADSNPCTLTLPCRSFAAAITQTSVGGEVIVLDSAGYGPVAVTQSVSIIAPAGVYAGISVPVGGTGVAIATAGASATLRGLSINGAGDGYGIRMTDGTELSVENCTIANFAGAINASGISIESAATVKISGTIVRDSENAIVVGFGANANILNSQIVRSGSYGIRLFGGITTTTNIVIADSLVSGNGYAGTTSCIGIFQTGVLANIVVTGVTVNSCSWAIENQPDGAGTIAVSNSTVTGNGFGILNNTTTSTGILTVTNSSVTGNVTGFANIGTGTFRSLGNNNVSGNASDIQGAITTIATQ